MGTTRCLYPEPHIDHRLLLLLLAVGRLLLLQSRHRHRYRHRHRCRRRVRRQMHGCRSMRSWLGRLDVEGLSVGQDLDGHLDLALALELELELESVRLVAASKA